MIDRLVAWWDAGPGDRLDAWQAAAALRWRPVRVVMTYRALRRRGREQRTRGRLGYSRRDAWTMARRS